MERTFCFVKTVLLFAVVSTSATDEGSLNLTQQLNGQTLKDIGAKLRKPILQLLGDTIIRVEEKVQETACSLQRCSTWTPWSPCVPLKLNGFGFRQRNQTCAREKGSCYFKTNNTVETASEICLTTCPAHYYEQGGYCLRLYNKTKANYSDSERQCAEDGGYLINIDSESKYGEVTKFLLEQIFSTSTGIWIDGQKKSASSSWEYKYGSSAGFYKWYPGEPDNTSSEPCLVIGLYGSYIKWHDSGCNNLYSFMCEVI